MEFKSGIDNYYKILSNIVILILLGTNFLIVLQEVNSFTIIISLIIFLLTLYLILLPQTIKYFVFDGQIIAEQLFIRKKVNLIDVIKITDKFSLLNTPAIFKMGMSSKAITIKFRTDKKVKWLTISPDQQELFLEEIMKQNPEILIERVKK